MHFRRYLLRLLTSKTSVSVAHFIIPNSNNVISVNLQQTQFVHSV